MSRAAWLVSSWHGRTTSRANGASNPEEGGVTQPIYKLWQGRFTEAWHQLPAEEQERLMAQVMEALGSVGGKELVVCSAAWSNEQWPFFGLEQLPDMGAVQRHAE